MKVDVMDGLEVVISPSLRGGGLDVGLGVCHEVRLNGLGWRDITHHQLILDVKLGGGT